MLSTDERPATRRPGRAAGREGLRKGARVRASRAGLAAFAAAFACLAVAFPAGPGAAFAADGVVGREAPDFTQRLLSGGNFRLSERRGEVVVLGFWTSWCSGCRAQLERLARLDATYGSAGLVVVGVSLDDDATRATSLAEAVDARFRNLIDVDKRVGRAYRVDDLPMTVLIDRAGRIRHVLGETTRRDEAALLEEIRRLLDE